MFISTLFDSGINGISTVRIDLCKAFCLRYPNVLLLTNINNTGIVNSVYIPDVKDKGFIDYTIINKFLDDYKYLCKFLVIIDSDLHLESDFFQKMTKKMLVQESLIVQGFSKSNDLFRGRIMTEKSITSSIKNNGNGHTGYIWGFSRYFLYSIGHQFPSCFNLGGFDYFLVNPKLVCSMLPKGMKRSLKDFRRQLRIAKFDYLDHNILHEYHGPSKLRLTNFADYHKVYLNENQLTIIYNRN